MTYFNFADIQWEDEPQAQAPVAPPPAPAPAQQGIPSPGTGRISWEPAPVSTAPAPAVSAGARDLSNIEWEPAGATQNRVPAPAVGIPAPKPDPSLLRTAGRGLAHGTLGLGETVGEVTAWLGNRLGSEGMADVGETTSRYWGEKAEAFAPPESLEGKNVWDNPELLRNASWWAYNVADMVPSFAATLVPGAAAGKGAQAIGAALKYGPKAMARLAKVGQMIGGGIAGGAMEGAQTYKAVKAQGASEEEAARAGELMALGAGVLNAIATPKILDGAGGALRRILGGAAWEGLTEGAEEPTEVFARYFGKYLAGEPLPQDLGPQLIQSLKEGLTVAPIAAVTGGGAGMVFGGGAQEPAGEVAQPPAQVEPGRTEDTTPQPTGNLIDDYNAGHIGVAEVRAVYDQLPEGHPMKFQAEQILNGHTPEEMPVDVHEVVRRQEEPAGPAFPTEAEQAEMRDLFAPAAGTGAAGGIPLPGQPAAAREIEWESELPGMVPATTTGRDLDRITGGIPMPGQAAAAPARPAAESAAVFEETLEDARKPGTLDRLRQKFQDEEARAWNESFGGMAPYVFGSGGLLERVKSGEPGRRVQVEPGTQEWTGFSTTYPEFMRDKGLTAKEVVTALEKAYTGAPLGPKQEGIVEHAIEQARQERRQDLIEYAELVEADPRSIQGLDDASYRTLIEEIENEGYTARDIEEAAAKYRNAIQSRAVQAIAESEGLSEEEIASLIADPAVPEVDLDEAWREALSPEYEAMAAEEERRAEAVRSDTRQGIPEEGAAVGIPAPPGEYVEGDQGPAIQQRPGEGRPDQQFEPEEPARREREPVEAQPTPEAQSEATKEPWEMARGEFVEANQGSLVKQRGRKVIEGVQVGDTIYPLPPGSQKNGKLTRPFDEVLGEVHRQIVKDELASNEQKRLDDVSPYAPKGLKGRKQSEIPESVLKDYPDLQPKKEAAPEARPEVLEPTPTIETDHPVYGKQRLDLIEEYGGDYITKTDAGKIATVSKDGSVVYFPALDDRTSPWKWDESINTVEHARKYLDLRNEMRAEWEAEKETKPFPQLAQEAVQDTPDYTEGANRVFISDAYETAQGKGYQGSLDDFKADLIQAHRDNELSLERADLVEAMPREKVQASEANLGRGRFHLIKRPKAPAVPSAKEIDQAAREADTTPTEPQKEAGNYKKGHFTWNGLDLSIENPKGSTRSGVDEGGQRWESKLRHHYGYIRRTEGADGDQVDAFMGPQPESAKVFVVDQVNPKAGAFDEHKALLGFPTEQQARMGYLANYQKGWRGLGAITEMSVDEFKAWLKEGDQTRPVAEGVGVAVTPKAPETPEGEYPLAGETVDGRVVRDEVPNQDSIGASVEEPEILKGVREVPMSDFELTGRHYSKAGNERIAGLAEEIKASGEINPLIVVVEPEGPYILEGATRADALYRLGAKSFPAMVVRERAPGEAEAAPLTIEDYSEKSIVVRGDTKPHKDRLKKLKGLFNAKLKGGPGWIFPKKREDEIRKALAALTGEEVEATPAKQPEKEKRVATVIPHPDGGGFAVKAGPGYVSGGAGPGGGGSIGKWPTVKDAIDKGTAHFKKGKWRVDVSEEAREAEAMPKEGRIIDGHLQTPDRKARWWENLFRAREAARDLGIDHRGMSLDEIVEQVDAVDQARREGKTETVTVIDAKGMREQEVIVEGEKGPDLTLGGQQRPVPGRDDGATYTVHKNTNKSFATPEDFKVVMSREQPWLSVSGYGDTAREAYDNALTQFERKIGEQAAAKAPTKAAKKAKSPKDKFISDLTTKGAARVGRADYKILQHNNGSFYYTKTEDGVRYEKGPGYPAKWTRAEAIDEALKEARYDLEAAPEPKPETPKGKAAPARGLADWVKGLIQKGKTLTWQGLFQKADKIFGGTQAEGAYTPKDAYDAMELGFNLRIEDMRAVNPRNDIGDARSNIRNLKEAQNRLPTQSKRTEEADEFQQFSTPHAFAYAAAWTANITGNDTVLEPSAGTGNIATMAKKAGAERVVVNELSDRRLALLKELSFDRYHQEDAAQLNNILPRDERPTVVLMNPPFSATAGRVKGRRKTSEGARHVEQALKYLQDDGRLVAIVGKGMADNKPAFRDWWEKIKGQYNVRANIRVSGKEYQKYGTTFDNQLIVIDKTGKTEYDTITGEVEKIEDLLPLLEGIRDDRAARKQRPAEQGGEERPEAGGREPGAEPAPLPAVGAVGGGEREGGPGERPVRPPAEPGRPSAPVGAEEGAGVPGGAGEPRRPERPAARAEEAPVAGRGRPESPGQPAERGARGVSPAKGPASELQIEAKEHEARGEEISEDLYEGYRPERLTIAGAKRHPAPLVQSAAMAAVTPPAPTYTPNLPKKIIDEGRVSDIQLESVVYAGQSHEQTLPDGSRRGYFIGDGTGVGKGREIGAIIWDNWNQGRKKAVWVSEKQTLLKDAKRDLEGIGWTGEHLIPHSKIKATAPIASETGVLFTTYDTAKSRAKAEGAQTRLDQIVDWLGEGFDGVIAFDESHNMGNALAVKGERGMKEPSAKALAGVELQRRLPNARVVYVSATGATEVINLAYADRLGLWGDQTPFATKESFVESVAAGGVAAMEMVARDTKALGLYNARSISYDGVEYDRLVHELTADQRDMYDRLAEAWQVVLQNINAALEEIGAVDEDGKSLDRNAKANAYSAFWGAHQRFFNQIITAVQTPATIEAIKKDLAEGRSVVVQLTNTMEAAQERSLSKMSEEDSLEDLDITPRDSLMQLVQGSFPVAQYEQYTDADGNLQARMVTDSNGNPVQNPEAVAMREALLDEIGAIRVPEAPIDMIVNEFGAKNVAEITGRKRRVIEGKKGREIEKRGKARRQVEADEFMAGKRRVLIFSEAGGTGRSYHADLEVGNQEKRVHYLLQAGWRADKAMQGLGRTHRSNQKQPPKYVLVTTDLKGQKRFVSSIARRLDQLGALTKGQRQTGSQGIFEARDNLESDYARDALRRFWDDLYRGQVEAIDIYEFQRQTGLRLTDDKGNMVQQLPPIQQFLNRLLSMKTDTMNAVFDEYGRRLDEVIEAHVEAGTLDMGLETLKASKIEKIKEETVYTDERSGAETKYVQLRVENPAPILKWGEAKSYAKDGFWRNKKSGKVWAARIRNVTNRKTGIPEDRYSLRGANFSENQVKVEDFDLEKWERVPVEQAKEAWKAEIDAAPKTTVREEHLVTGTVLPIWNRLPQGHARIMRVQTEDGDRMIGRLIPKGELKATLRNLGAESAAVKVTPEELYQRVFQQGDQAELANGWKIQRRRVSGDERIEIVGPGPRDMAVLQKHGVFSERIQWQTRFFVPTAKDVAVPALEAITKSSPVVAMQETGASPQFSRHTPDHKTPARPVRADQLSASINRAVDQLPGMRGAVEVVQSESDLPGPALAAVKRAGMEGQYNGMHYRGKVYIVADNLSSLHAGKMEFLGRLIEHEGRHWALDQVFPNQVARNRFMRQVAEAYRGEISEWLSRYGVEDTAINRAMAAEEVLVDQTLRGATGRLIDRFLARVAEWARRVFPDLRITKAEARNLLEQVEAVMRGEAGGGAFAGEMVPQFMSKTALDQITSMPAFERWFGSSKIEHQGDPVIMYRGRIKEGIGRGRGGAAVLGEGYYFTASPQYAGMYPEGRRGANIVPAFLSVQNPLVWDQSKPLSQQSRDVQEWHALPRGRARSDFAKSKGYDGVVWRRKGQGPGSLFNEVVVFDQSQAKSVFNAGSFDPARDIRFMRNEPTRDDNLAAWADQYIADAMKKPDSAKAKRVRTEKEYFEGEGYRKDAVDSAREVIESTKKAVANGWLKERPDTTILERWLGTAEFYFQKVPAAWRVFRAGLERTDDYHQNYNDLTADESRIAAMKQLKKQRPKEYAKLRDLMVRADMNQVKHTAAGLRKKGFSDQAVDAWQAFRDNMDAGFDRLHAEMEAMIEDRLRKGLDLPTVVTWVGDEKVEVDLRVALAQMGKMKGWYFPRIRKSGRYMLVAKKAGENPILEFFDLKHKANQRGKELQRQGYAVTKQKSKDTPEDVFRLAGQSLGMQALFNQALERLGGQRATLESFGLQSVDRIVDRAMMEDVTEPIVGSRKIKPGLRDFMVVGPTPKWMTPVLRDIMGGKFYSAYNGEPKAWHFYNPGRNFENRLARALAANNPMGQTVDQQTTELFAYQLATMLSDIVKERGYRSSMEKRVEATGKDVWIGYETDPLEAMAKYTMGLSAGLAKRDMALKMVRAVTGSDISWDDFKLLQSFRGTFEEFQGAYDIPAIDREVFERWNRPDALENQEAHLQDLKDDLRELRRQGKSSGEEADRLRDEIAGGQGWRYQQYEAMVRERRIDPEKQKNIFHDTTAYMEEMLRNQEFADRVIGVVKGMTVLKYLGFRLASPLVNLTALVTSVPASMNAHAGVPLHRIPGAIVKGLDLYSRYRWGDKSRLDPDVVELFDTIHEKGWANAQYNMEALAVLRSKLGGGYERLMNASMYLFGATESLNRVATIAGGYVGQKEEAKRRGRKFDVTEAIEKAKHASDRSHGTYGRATLPYLAQGSNPFAQAGRCFYVFSKFSHTYLQNMYEIGFQKKNAKALTYMMLSPAILAGAGAVPVLWPTIMLALSKLLDVDEPEERLYSWLTENVGSLWGELARTGVAGWGGKGINMKGSLGLDPIGGFPTSIPELLGAPADVMLDLYYGGKDILKGRAYRGIETVAPMAIGRGMAAYREAQEGVTTHGGTPKLLEGERMEPTMWDTLLQITTFNPAHMAKLKEKKWSQTKLIWKYRGMKGDIYDKLRDYYNQPPERRSPEDMAGILADIEEYNARVVERDLFQVEGISPITRRSIQSALRATR